MHIFIFRSLIPCDCPQLLLGGKHKSNSTSYSFPKTLAKYTNCHTRPPSGIAFVAARTLSPSLVRSSRSEAVDQIVRVGLRDSVKIVVKVKSLSDGDDRRTPSRYDLRYAWGGFMLTNSKPKAELFGHPCLIQTS